MKAAGTVGQSNGASGSKGTGGWLALVALAQTLVVPASAGAASTVMAQLGPNPGSGPSYGYQPYDDRNPTGFYHPQGMGYGHYYLTQKRHAPRFGAFRYRKFRGN